MGIAIFVIVLVFIIRVMAADKDRMKKGQQPPSVRVPLDRQPQQQLSQPMPATRTGIMVDPADFQLPKAGSPAYSLTPASSNYTAPPPQFTDHYSKDRMESHKALAMMEDRQDDWLARQLREESRRKLEISAMLDLKMSHEGNCDADALRQMHQENCDAEQIRRQFRG